MRALPWHITCEPSTWAIRDQEIVRKVADILYRRGRVAQADDVIEKWEEQGTAETPEIGRLASRISAALGEDLDRALEKAEIPITAGLEESGDHLWIGRVHAIRREWQDAYDSIDKAITLAPKDDVAYLAMVQLLVAWSKQCEADKNSELAKEKIAEAERVVTQATKDIEADKRDQVVGQCYELLGRIDDAAKKFDEATKEKPERFRVCWKQPFVST